MNQSDKNSKNSLDNPIYFPSIDLSQYKLISENKLLTKNYTTQYYQYNTKITCNFKVYRSNSCTIDYNIQNSDILFIDNHFIFENSNATTKYQDSVFDIYRLEFISNDSKNIQYKIKDIRWVQSNHQVHKILHHQ